MNFGALKGVIGAVAPTLGTALAGPLGGTAAQAISAVLGCKNDPKSISTAMQNATPEQLAEIKKAELDFEAQMKKMDVDIFALETADVQDARKAHKGDWTPRIFGLFSLNHLKLLPIKYDHHFTLVQVTQKSKFWELFY